MNHERSFAICPQCSIAIDVRPRNKTTQLIVTIRVDSSKLLVGLSL